MISLVPPNIVVLLILLVVVLFSVNIHSVTAVGTRRSLCTHLLLLDRRDPLLLCRGIDVGANDKRHQIEEGHPSMGREELLGDDQGNWAGAPGNFHDGHEASFDGGTDLMGGAGASNDSHACEINCVLDGRDDQVRHQDLHNLGLSGGSAGEGLLQSGDEDVTQRRGNQGSVYSHLGNAGREI